MRIGIVTAWGECGAGMVSRAYMELLSQRHEVFVFARGGFAYTTAAAQQPAWNLPNVTWGKRSRSIGSDGTYINWNEFKDWTLHNRLDAILFNEQRDWNIIVNASQLDVLLGAYVDYYTAETVPFFDLYDFLICNTERHYSVFKDHPQAFYVPWGTDVDLFKPKSGEQKTKSDTLTFFHSSGSVTGRKGTDILLSAFPQVKGDVELVIHSQVNLDQLDFSHYVNKNDRIRIIQGEYPAPGLYYFGDVYVYPTRLEGIGLTVPEALACGMPVITTDSPPMSEFVKDKVNGSLVAVERFEPRWDGYYWPQNICSEAALVDAMQYYVDNKPRIEELAHNARSYALEHLDWRKNARELPEIFERLTPQASRNPALIRRASTYVPSRFRHIPKALLPIVNYVYALGLFDLIKRIGFMRR